MRDLSSRDLRHAGSEKRWKPPLIHEISVKASFHVYTDLELTCAQLELMPAFPDRSAYSRHWLTSLNSLFVQGGMLLPGTCTGTGEYGE